MRVLIVNSTDGGGGAANAMLALHKALLAEDVDSHVAVGRQTLHDNQRIHSLHSKSASLDRVLNAITWRLGWDGIQGTSSFKLLQEDPYQNADVVNLHAIHGGYFNYLAVRRMAKVKPVVLTLHDMWHFTGHCVYSFDCERWKTGCGRCPYPDVYAGVQRDATAFNWRMKRTTFARPNIHLVAISNWMQRLLSQSFLRDVPTTHIPNGIDTDAYSPRDKAAARRKLGLTADRFIVLCCAADLSDSRKGGDLLVDALNGLSEGVRRAIYLVVMGNASEQFLRSLPVEHKCLGFVSDVAIKADAYSSADLFVFPTRADNLPVVLQEALACGVPQISFDVGGVSDLVRDGETGWLCPAGSVSSLATAIECGHRQPDLMQKMSERCRQVAEAEFPLALQGRRYRELFEKELQAMQRSHNDVAG